ncbi:MULTISPECIES: transglutaminase family protein [unclassified Sphingomonas]|uniref:transglutaminase family protein n=1 Tax=unclassified Sphingomonas TaxID=196159 RepID=UPI0006FAAD82|nr:MULTISPECIES: transglutaminase family protein [unclassified Sphingomonas]KQX25400.1 transglutaminase [Sphingomonas sp. Root1294]KQY66392.1 transglutaminase [Sphingomonas sp. Root50]KRB90292.1 transglutaminase [Sphingomonas sp. Root720]
MQRLVVRHRTSYRYAGRVTLGQHRLMLRPRQSRGVELRSFALSISPEPQLSWSDDVYGNGIVTASFGEPTDHLVIQSVATIDLDAEPWPVFPIDPSAMAFPFLYPDRTWSELGALAVPPADPDGSLHRWARGFVAGVPTDTLALLKDLNAGTGAAIAYMSRDEEGTQDPCWTLRNGRGSCRDLAMLFVAAARSLGFGARAVSGYLHSPAGAGDEVRGAGSTHAWAEVYVPGSGWIAFDPTNRTVGGFNLVPVAVASDISLILPVTGSFSGDGTGDMVVDVEVSTASPEDASSEA